ncbi:hypothetical protein CEE45_05565 [Candidatus Heimdallarchaeota archaeon B3_Heim]|nr:MAG: hypothetical protein CEE45_05565 [Candidatus Heimdallarchaeota archaeon B3_Heim]
MSTQKRDQQGKFTSENPRRFIMRVTAQEKKLVEKFRQIKPSKSTNNNHSLEELQALIRKRVDNIEL